MARSIVSVGEYGSGPEAALAQGFLGEEEIEAELAGVITQAWAYGLTVLTNTVRVEVRADDAARAHALMAPVDARIRARVHREIEEERGRVVAVPPAPAPRTEAPTAEVEDEWEEPEDLPPHDRAARRVYVAAVLGLWFQPIMVIALILWFWLPRRDELSPPGRRYQRVATWLIGAWLTVIFAVLTLRDTSV